MSRSLTRFRWPYVAHAVLRLSPCCRSTDADANTASVVASMQYLRMTKLSWSWRVAVMAAITCFCVLVGIWVVPTQAGGDPYVLPRICGRSLWSCGGISHAFPSWAWPTMCIVILSAFWLVAVHRLIVRPARRIFPDGSTESADPARPMGPKPKAEGWYRDPFGTHENRWFSDGEPTALVRDGRNEGNDPPPLNLSADSVPSRTD
jgi:hypothetical protein